MASLSEVTPWNEECSGDVPNLIREAENFERKGKTPAALALYAAAANKLIQQARHGQALRVISRALESAPRKQAGASALGCA